MDLFLVNTDTSKSKKPKHSSSKFDKKEYAVTRGKEMVYCPACEKEVSYYALSKHNKSKTHLKNEIGNQNEKKKAQNILFDKVKDNMKTFTEHNNKFDIKTKKEQDKEIDDYLKLSKKIKVVDSFKAAKDDELDIAYNGILDIMNQWRENRDYIDEDTLKELNKFAKKIIKNSV